MKRVIVPLLLFCVASLLAACSSEPPPASVEMMSMVVESSSPLVASSQTSELVVTFDVAAAPPEALGRKPLNLSLVLDHSGSMTDEMMVDARAALRYMLEELEEDDQVSVVVFSSRAEVLLARTEWGDADKEAIYASLDKLEPRGTTSMADALQQALAQVRAGFDAKSINRIILLSDGIPNNPALIGGLAQQARGSEIGITTMGLGPYYNEDLMVQIADTSGGRYRCIAKSGDIEKFFREEKHSMENLVARQATLTLTLGNGVRLEEMIGGQPSISGQRVDVFLGDMDAQSNRKLAVKLKVAAPASGAKVEIMDAILRWQDVASGGVQLEKLAYVEATSTKDVEQVEGEQRREILDRYKKYGAIESMNKAIINYQRGDRATAQKQLEGAASSLSAIKNRPTRQPRRAPGLAAGQGAGAAPVVAPLAAERAEPAAEGTEDVAELEAYVNQQIDNVQRLDPSSGEGKLIIKEVKATSRGSMGY